jgi:hypothetical protein
MTSSRILLLGLSVTLAWSGVAYAQNTEVPPEAPRRELAPAVTRALAENPAQRIVLLSSQVDDPSKPGATQTRSLHVSTNPTTGESKVFTKLVVQPYKRICFHVAPSVQGQIGTIVRQMTPSSTALAVRPDSLALRTGLRSTYAKAIRTRNAGNAPAMDAGIRFVAAEHQVRAGGTGCVDLPFDSGDVEVTWLLYGTPNPEAQEGLPVKGADGRMPFRLVRYKPLFLGTDPDQIESSAQVIHTTVVNLDQGAVIEDREL